MISASDYQKLVCNIEKANADLHMAVVEMISMQTDLANITTSDSRRLPLKSAIESMGNKLQDKVNRNDEPVIAFVQALQDHIKKYYGDVNTFLTANSIKIPTYFASVSKQVGYEIKPANQGVPVC